MLFVAIKVSSVEIDKTASVVIFCAPHQKMQATPCGSARKTPVPDQPSSTLLQSCPLVTNVRWLSCVRVARFAAAERRQGRTVTGTCAFSQVSAQRLWIANVWLLKSPLFSCLLCFEQVTYRQSQRTKCSFASFGCKD